MLKITKYILWGATAVVLAFLAYSGFIYASPERSGALANFIRSKDGILLLVILTSEMLAAWLVRDVWSSRSSRSFDKSSVKEPARSYARETPKQNPQIAKIFDSSDKRQDEAYQRDIARLREVVKERLN